MTFYALNLTVDFTHAASGQVEDPGPNSRQWFTSPDAINWTPLPGNADGPNHPTLHYPTSNPAAADLLVVSAFFLNQPAGQIISRCSILATFTGQRRRAVDVSSPFRRADGSVCGILGLGVDASLNPSVNAYSIPPVPISIDPTRLRPNRPNPLPFEFSVCVRFFLSGTSGNSIIEFNYDPEMEVSIDN